MTMPDKITAWEFMPSEQNEWMRGGWDFQEERSHEMTCRNYVAADIADELARALGGVMHYIQGYAGSDEQDVVDAALARYNAINSTPQ